MKRLIDCRRLELQEFVIKKGYQPKHALFYILSGEIEFFMSGIRCRAGEGTLVSFPDTVYFERKILRPTVFYYVRYEAPATHTLPIGLVNIGDMGRLLSTLQYLLQLSDRVGEEHLKNGFLADIFHQIEIEALLADTAKDRIMARVQYFFEKNLLRKITLDEVAKVACLSPSGLNHHFKKSVGLTPMEYLTALRLKKAEALLCYTRTPVAEIAALCGFESPYYFSNTFKKHVGDTPTEHRRKYGM